jgi:hypothetical protein
VLADAVAAKGVKFVVPGLPIKIARPASPGGTMLSYSTSLSHSVLREIAIVPEWCENVAVEVSRCLVRSSTVPGI